MEYRLFIITGHSDNCEPDQSRDFTSIALKPGTKLWSKAGWTSTVRHDAAYMELPDGRKFEVRLMAWSAARVSLPSSNKRRGLSAPASTSTMPATSPG